MAGIGGLRDGEQEGPADQESERDLARGGAAGLGDLGEDPAPRWGDGNFPEPKGL